MFTDRLAFDPLDDDIGPKSAAEFDDRSYDRDVTRAVHKILDEQPVNLDLCDGKLPQVP